MKIIKLNTMVTDAVTGMEGMLTMAIIDMDGTARYVFQPRGLNPETRQPVTRILLESSRVENGILEEVNLPMEVLGSEVEDIATGFTGIAVQINYHINGCVHFEVKPRGFLEKSGDSIEACDFDYRRLKGPAIKVMTEEELEVSKIKKPSPERKLVSKYGL